MAKAKKTTASKINADTLRAYELLDAAAMSMGENDGKAGSARADMSRALRLLGYKYANESGDAVQAIKARGLLHYTVGWLKGNGKADNADAKAGTNADAYAKLEGKASDPASPKGRAKLYKDARDSAWGMAWRRACDDADPDGAKVRIAEQAAKRAQAGKADKPAPKATPKKAKALAVDAAVLQAFETIAKSADLTAKFMAWAAENLPDIK